MASAVGQNKKGRRTLRLMSFFSWIAFGVLYTVFAWSLCLAYKLKVESVKKVLIFIGLFAVHPFASLIFIAWYFNKFKTLKPI